MLGRVFHELRLVEHWGSGIQSMNTACKEAGLPSRKLEEIGSHFRVPIYRERVNAARMDATDEQILSAVKDRGTQGTTAIAKSLRLSNRATLTRLNDLKSRGLVVEIGTGPHDRKRKYALAI